jgi:pyruvate-formate lyase
MIDAVNLTYQQRIDALRATKLAQTQEKQAVIGAMDHDDWALVLPPPELRMIVDAISSSGMPIKDVLLRDFEIESNHPSGGFFGPKLCGENFRRLLELHPVYIDPMSSLAGAYMFNFTSYRKPRWNPDLDYSHLRPDIEEYGLISGIGASQHFCQDLTIGLELGWSGLLDKIRHYRKANTPDGENFYDGLEAVVLGIQNWIQRHAEAANQMAQVEPDPQKRNTLKMMAGINTRLVTEPPETFVEACQWIVWYQMAARMYNGSGSLGRLDVLLQPYYDRDRAAGNLTDEEATFHVACLLLRDTAYLQLGGPHPVTGDDVTSPLSFLVLEAMHQLKTPTNVGVCVGDQTDLELLRRGVEILFEDKQGCPKFLGVDNTTNGYLNNGYSSELARSRAYSGCHWSAVPGREYTINDCIKINMALVFDIALRDMMKNAEPSMETLWQYFEKHLQYAVDVVAASLDYHVEHMHQVFPELVLDLCCYGPIEKGIDASNGGVELINFGVDGAALATVADSMAAIEQRIKHEKRLTWDELLHHLDTDWSAANGERTRLMMHSIQRYGHGNTFADEYAARVSSLFIRLVKSKPTPAGYNMIPAFFSWANTISLGKKLGATPNGRHAAAPISHGASPDPGFRKDGAPTAMAVAVASVQSAYGNASPMQIDMEPTLSKDEGGVDNVVSLIKTHFDLGGTQINMNVVNKEQILEAHKDPGKYPDLVVRVTGFSAYFASLSPEFRQLVVDRIIAG